MIRTRAQIGEHSRIKCGTSLSLSEGRGFPCFSTPFVPQGRATHRIRLLVSWCLDPSEMQIRHTISRRVRRAFLCRDNPMSGECYEHRRLWVRDKLEFLASVFGIDCLRYAIMSNRIWPSTRRRVRD